MKSTSSPPRIVARSLSDLDLDAVDRLGETASGVSFARADDDVGVDAGGRESETPVICAAAADRQEVCEQLVVPGLGQRVLDRERAVGMALGMDVRELLEIAADHEQVKQLVVNDSEVARLLAGDRMMHGEFELDWLARLEDPRRGLDLQP